MTTAKGVSFQKYNNGWTNTWTTLLDLVYPVGSVYIARKSFSPANKFGGAWDILDGGNCLRTFTGASCSSGGSDKHVHSAAGPSDWSNTRQDYGVRTSMTLGGTNYGDKTPGAGASEGSVIWSRWAPCRAGTLTEHPGFDATPDHGFDDGHGIAFTILKNSMDVWGNVTKDGSIKLGNTVYLEQFYEKFNVYTTEDGKTHYDGTGEKYGNTIPGCYGWTRPNSKAGTYRWDDQGEYNGDGSVPVAYYDVYAYERKS